MNETELTALLARLCDLRDEGTTVEFKSNLNQEHEIGEYISALANSALLAGHERAWVVWGVADETHEVKGTTFDPFRQTVGNQALVMWLQHKTAPRADFEFHQLNHEIGTVIFLEIHPPRSAPIAFDQTRYIRVDSHKTKLSQQGVGQNNSKA